MEGLFPKLLQWLPMLWWPFCRFIATLSVAPFVGETATPMRARVAIALVLAMISAPAMRDMAPIDPFSLAGIAAALGEVIIGLLFGLSLQLVMVVLSLLGFLLSSQMALSMATLNDPGNGSSSDVLSTLLYLFGALLFFTMDAHLVLVEVIYRSFALWPAGGGIPPQAMLQVVLGVGWAMSAALLLALPAIFATFVVQMGFGLINRVAPALNLFSLGFPLVTLFGLMTLTLVATLLPGHYVRLCQQIFGLWERMLTGGALG
ncbi:flagellar biosynthetic protein FliR [Craterilacuibacter sinensis]|uniref:Flagellar biosynthetic protein FliR n=1 Tax=Craterilacuibacter sinensis TaxID=2686017 RepID=A0A845BTB8_9NEIS|nr:flagellar biosynthetic protein FliR [Craterilacuibacter sinensis]MXR35803.1 flagellar biosynthetic protein FliR [Craterilacuibacter sinensis]